MNNTTFYGPKSNLLHPIVQVLVTDGPAQAAQRVVSENQTMAT